MAQHMVKMCIENLLYWLKQRKIELERSLEEKQKQIDEYRLYVKVCDQFVKNSAKRAQARREFRDGIRKILEDQMSRGEIPLSVYLEASKKSQKEKDLEYYTSFPFQHSYPIRINERAASKDDEEEKIPHIPKSVITNPSNQPSPTSQISNPDQSTQTQLDNVIFSESKSSSQLQSTPNSQNPTNPPRTLSNPPNEQPEYDEDDLFSDGLNQSQQARNDAILEGIDEIFGEEEKDKENIPPQEVQEDVQGVEPQAETEVEEEGEEIDEEWEPRTEEERVAFKEMDNIVGKR
ncbi:unnamed protein product [Moneuplotes crassus]|uniref:Uncharacterized protein n=1 Tax=Euplotes crassus TaxID=5936 RepID=A0AAD1XE80_EUPCR|nr:unnamed protein product [Moneuplotes crassus]